MRKQIRFIDLFAGIGGFHLGMKAAGAKCVFACEFDDNARKTYVANHSVASFARNIQDVKPTSIPEYDILCAGFPCQPFSISGHKQGFNDERANTVTELFRIIAETTPQAIILENVKHLQHVSRGAVFSKILADLEALGYTVAWSLLNAKDFGVPQNRERIVIVASKFKFTFPKRTGSNKDLRLRDFLDASNENDFEFMPGKFTKISQPVKQKSGLIFAGYRNIKFRTKGIRPGTEHLSRTHKQPNRIYSIDGVHPTLPSQETSGRFWILLDNGKVRKLTLAECFRLMGFPENFKKPWPRVRCTNKSATQSVYQKSRLSANR